MCQALTHSGKPCRASIVQQYMVRLHPGTDAARVGLCNSHGFAVDAGRTFRVETVFGIVFLSCLEPKPYRNEATWILETRMHLQRRLAANQALHVTGPSLGAVKSAMR